MSDVHWENGCYGTFGGQLLARELVMLLPIKLVCALTF